MAHEPGLKDLLKDLEATPEEMLAFRGNLAQSLGQQSRRRFPRILLPVAALAAAVVAAILLLPNAATELDEPSLEAVQQLVETHDKRALSQRAQVLLGSGSGWSKLNAYTILCLVLPSHEAIPYASQALEQDPRSEFRVFYLEYLLDRADENLINSDRVEELMDREEDEVCLRLLHDLLNVS